MRTIGVGAVVTAAAYRVALLHQPRLMRSKGGVWIAALMRQRLAQKAVDHGPHFYPCALTNS